MNILICDICESREKVTTQHYVTGSQVDVAGGPSEDDYDTFDLCQDCELKILRIHVYKRAKNRQERMDYGVPMIEIIKRLKENYRKAMK